MERLCLLSVNLPYQIKIKEILKKMKLGGELLLVKVAEIQSVDVSVPEYWPPKLLMNVFWYLDYKGLIFLSSLNS